MAYVETNFTFEHGGRTFEAGGAVVTDDFLIAYPARGGVLADWHGRVIGTWRTISKWPCRSWQGSHMHAIRAAVDGKQYHGRGFGEGMILRAKRCKGAV